MEDRSHLCAQLEERVGAMERIKDIGAYHLQEVEMDNATEMEHEQQIINCWVLSILTDREKSFRRLTESSIVDSKQSGKKEHAVINTHFSHHSDGMKFQQRLHHVGATVLFSQPSCRLEGLWHRFSGMKRT